jgi:hypothetical protein
MEVNIGQVRGCSQAFLDEVDGKARCYFKVKARNLSMGTFLQRETLAKWQVVIEHPARPPLE